MEEHNYSGVRLTLSVSLEMLRDTIKLDISTGDEIVPSAITFSYPVMFSNEKFDILSYNLETILAEKLETVLSRATLNTRMRDFYDIHILWEEKSKEINIKLLKEALLKVSTKRNTNEQLKNAREILSNIANSKYMQDNWSNYKNNNYYVGNLTWESVIATTSKLLLHIIDVESIMIALA